MYRVCTWSDIAAAMSLLVMNNRIGSPMDELEEWVDLGEAIMPISASL
jgi:hypothetical protein